MRLLHTGDWHLGQTLHGVSRAYEHQRFLSWLLDQLDQHKVDAFLLAGDIFDAASPGAEAQAQYFGFLAEARRRFPALDIVVVGGNHDTPARLDAARAVLDALRVHVVGGLPQSPDRTWDLERLLVPLKDSEGRVAARLLAVPFLRPKDLPASRSEARRAAGLDPERPPAEASAEEETIVAGHRHLYEALVEAAETQRPPNGALIATGHAYVAGGQLSELSERKIQRGNQQALPVDDTYPEALAYVALGHLHLAQSVSARVRYSGSPIPLSMAELRYPHQVLLVDLDGSSLRSVRSALVPRFVELIRLPETPAPLGEVLERLRALPRSGPPGATEPERPLLEVRVRLETAEPRLRQEVEKALEGAWARLLRIDVHRPQGNPRADLPPVDLERLDPEDVFRSAYHRSRGDTPSPELIDAFRELLEGIHQEA